MKKAIHEQFKKKIMSIDVTEHGLMPLISIN